MTEERSMMFEKAYLESKDFSCPAQLTESGDLHQVVTRGDFVFLLVLEHSFPEKTEDGRIPAKMCLVTPTLSELERKFSGRKIPCIVKEEGLDCLSFGDVEEQYERYLNGQYQGSFSEVLLSRTFVWAEMLQQMIRPAKGYGTAAFSGADREKYTDGRASAGGSILERCRKIVLSDRAYIQIYNESQERIQTETGGLLLGHFKDGVWYVVEASDPGINAKFYDAYHEGDDVYENHVCSVISRTYKYPLVFLGMWHRHPGSLDRFSGTDDRTNYKYAQAAGNGCISAIINYDPEFRITFYHAEQGDAGNIFYTRVDVETGDDKIPGEILKIADVMDVKRRLKRDSE